MPFLRDAVAAMEATPKMNAVAVVPKHTMAEHGFSPPPANAKAVAETAPCMTVKKTATLRPRLPTPPIAHRSRQAVGTAVN